MEDLSISAPRTALVFSGGGIKGAAFVGALRALEEAGASFELFGGTSAGSIAAVFAGAGMRVDEMEAVLDGFAAAPRRLQDYDLKGLLAMLTFSPSRYLGMLHGDKLERALAEILAERGVTHFADLVAPTFVVAVNALDGRELVFTNVPGGELAPGGHTQEIPVATALRASTAVPGVFAPKLLGAGVYIDGGVRNYLPIATAQRLGAKHILAITFAPQRDSREQVLAGGAISLLTRTIDLLIWDQLEGDLALLQAQGIAPVVLQLAIEDPRRFDLRQLPSLVEAGYVQTKQQLKERPEMLAAFRD